MFLLTLLGILIKRKTMFPDNGKDVLTDLLMYAFVPCNVINSFRVIFRFEILSNFMLVLIFAILLQLICFGINAFMYNKFPEREKKVLQYSTVCSNSAFIGLSVIKEVFGETGLMYGSFGTIPQAVVMWTAGVSYFAKTGSRKETIKKVATNPSVVAIYIGLILLIFQIPLPKFISSTIEMVGGCTLPASMILIGTVLAEVKDIRSMFLKKIWFFSLIRLILIPLLVLVAGKLLHINKLLAGIIILMGAMPAGSTSVMFASKFHGDYIFATKCVVVTTALSLITIPLWCLLL
jgi:predicted permease